MCGIVGTIRSQGSVVEGLVEGLRLLEYRGYDSSGVAVALNGDVLVCKRAGRLDQLQEALADDHLAGALAGIGHTRWATHGPPTDENAHPHTGAAGRIAIVHNGILENYLPLRTELEASGSTFRSDTDTEVLAHLIERELDHTHSLAEAVRRCLRKVHGYYAVAVIGLGPDGPQIVCARQGPPLALTVSSDGAYLASDVMALLSTNRDITFLEHGDVAELGPGTLRITTLDGTEVVRKSEHIDYDQEFAGKEPYPHFMLKEIHEQPEVIVRTVHPRVNAARGDFEFENGQFGDEFVRSLERVQIIACGSALHAGWITRYMIEGLAGVPVDVDFASEFRYRDPCLVPGTLALAISQSGETADTLAAMRRAASLGAHTGAICNVPGSSQVRESDQVILTHAGPEIGVASTKAFTAQVAAGLMLAVRMGRARGTLTLEQGIQLQTEMLGLSAKLDAMLTERALSRVKELAEHHCRAKGFLFLGRGINYPVALEGALKLKEISYAHAEGYPAGEMKHGPIALIEPGMTVVTINSIGKVADKVRSNVEQVKARGGEVLCIGSDPESHTIADEGIVVPESSEWISPILNSIPLQLFAYYVADLRGCDIDKPRNLAKSVTVE